jgi:hypothetical protein
LSTSQAARSPAIITIMLWAFEERKSRQVKERSFFSLGQL